jgi:hypothetical protein
MSTITRKIIETKTTFAKSVYKNFMAMRFGMEPCCILDMESATIKKELCDWDAMNSKLVTISDVYSSTLDIQVCQTSSDTGIISWTSADIQALIDRIEILEVVAAIDEKDLNYVHTQASPLATWTITHNLDKNPSVRIEDLVGNDIIAQIDYVDTNTLTIIFAIPVAGTAYLN